MESLDPELDALLRRHPPAPDPAWVRTTGERLFHERRRRPAVWLASAAAGGLASLGLALSFAGVGPLAGGDQAVQAKDECRTVVVRRHERLPSLVTAKDGSARIVYRRQLVRRSVRRCD